MLAVVCRPSLPIPLFPASGLVAVHFLGNFALHPVTQRGFGVDEERDMSEAWNIDSESERDKAQAPVAPP